MLFKSTPHEYLYVEAKQFCGDGKKFEQYINAIENKDYTLALRKASSVGSLPLVRLVLKFGSQLNIDINQPSKSNE